MITPEEFGEKLRVVHNDTNFYNLVACQLSLVTETMVEVLHELEKMEKK